jgi:hypothetical protein
MNSEVNSEIRNALKIMQSTENIPIPTPVIEVGTKSVKNALIKSGSAINATSATLMTTSAFADTYVFGASISVIKDATSTSVSEAIQLTPDETGLAVSMLQIASLTLTIQSQSVSIMLPHPIKIKRGSVIAIANSTNVGNITTTAQIYYYLDEVANG